MILNATTWRTSGHMRGMGQRDQRRWRAHAVMLERSQSSPSIPLTHRHSELVRVGDELVHLKHFIL